MTGSAGMRSGPGSDSASDTAPAALHPPFKGIEKRNLDGQAGSACRDFASRRFYFGEAHSIEGVPPSRGRHTERNPDLTEGAAVQNRALRFTQGFFSSTYFDADSFDRRVIIRLNRQRHCVVPMIGSAIVQGSGCEKTGNRTACFQTTRSD
ncbi:hypothetical protein MPLDJ20_90192 [Mesorhizobium plurifarium]|uniref:Uncharacterized protein n=1 Tax=Mesorhizobium plurifarium TaxID=69974 RepID=A0A090FS75_MESPL|nr:hypothetical protein MPLDJ20_90192 [Mesorhizobium plurifarium]